MMIHNYSNREIAHLLEINLARWKRWSRAFLPPDPLGGMQSGYARQYAFKDLFKVFLGGHLLGHLKLSVAQSQQVLKDLSPWMKKEGFLRPGGPRANRVGIHQEVERIRIYFCPKPVRGGKTKTAYRYLIRKTVKTDLSERPDGWMVSETYEVGTLKNGPAQASPEDVLDDPYVSLINFTSLYAMVVAKLLG